MPRDNQGKPRTITIDVPDEVDDTPTPDSTPDADLSSTSDFLSSTPQNPSSDEPELSIDGVDMTKSLNALDEGKSRRSGQGKANKGKKHGKNSQNWVKRHKILFTLICLIVIAGAAFAVWYFCLRTPDETPAAQNGASTPAVHYYSKLSGEEISSESLNSSPTYCMQVPNGMDGARPQVGLHSAPVIFEAIAEAGITRFAAIFQNNDSSVIGPIRSLRPYYLQWDTPFDCTVVHAGGSKEALADLKAGNHRDLTESTTYMWRDEGAGYARPNNLFTSGELLTKFNGDNGYTSSDLKAFPRLTPDAAAETAKANRAAAEPLTTEESQTAADGNTKSREVVPLTTEIAIRFGGNANYNVNYVYNPDTNSYARSYANGQPHTSYACPADTKQPHPQTACGEATQLTPKVVIAMVVQQSSMDDGYHQQITTVGSGKAYIFQNGSAVEGTWSKSSVSEQIEFKDADGKTISFTPGQLWISAIPASTGSVGY